jgi:NAD(P)-dependent dehydrogenase (short-subunit alcohol dehydrogenase family)
MASKAAVVHMTKGLALEWARFNIRVNAIAPGYIRTPMTEDVLANPKAEAAIVAMVPQKKIGEIADIAAVALFLASDCTKFVTGQTIASDGGRTVW